MTRDPDPIRREIIKALLAGGLAAGSLPAWAAGTRPAVPGIQRFAGQVTVNGQPARVGAQVNSGDVVATGADSHAVIVIEQDAFLLREHTRVAFRHAESLLNVIAGKILSVMASGRARNVKTASATIGIRGTGFYIEIDADRTYLCSCYGTVEMGPASHAARETVVTKHHEAPRYIYNRAAQAILPAPVINHTDEELIMLEALVGRSAPFSYWRSTYSAY